MIAGLPRRLPVRFAASMLARSVVPAVPVEVRRSRRHIAPSMLKSCFAVDGLVETKSSEAPPTELLLMMVIGPVGGTPLPVPKICAAAAAATGGGTPPTGAAPKL